MDLSRQRFLFEELERAEESLRRLSATWPALHTVIRSIEELLAKLGDRNRKFPIDVEVRYELWLKEQMRKVKDERTGAA